MFLPVETPRCEASKIHGTYTVYSEEKIQKYEEYSNRIDFDKSLTNLYNLHVVIRKPK